MTVNARARNGERQQASPSPHPYPAGKARTHPGGGARGVSPPTAFVARPSTRSPRPPACRSRTCSIISAARRTSTTTLMQRLLDTWLAPLRELDDIGDPLTELRSYIRRKLEMARDFPRESRLFANEILQGAPRIMPLLEGELKALVDEKADRHQGLDARRQDRPHRPLAPDLLDLGDDAALCRFRRPGARRARARPRRRGPLRGRRAGSSSSCSSTG